jgi:hypothetical protein
MKMEIHVVEIFVRLENKTASLSVVPFASDDTT